MLKDEPLEVQRAQYDSKNAVLEANGEWVSAWTMYEDIFPDMDMVLPVVMIDEEEQKHIVKMSIAEAVSACEGRNDVLLGGTSYFNEFISKATAKNIYTLIIDMDNVYSGVLQRAFELDWRREGGEPVPMPTYIVNSGTGLHLYFVFDRPLPCYKSQMAQIDQMYRRLAVLETTKRIFLPSRPSVQWFGQDFRMAGGNGKNGWRNTCFRVGERWNADKLAEAVGLSGVHFNHAGDQKRKGKKNIQKDGNGKPYPKRKGYYLNARVYESSVERCEGETKEGNRYTSMCALSVLAWKCRIPRERLEKDLHALLVPYNKDAMKMYNEKAMQTPKLRTQDWLGWNFKGARRNGRKQETHLILARSQKSVLKKIGEMKPEGRPTAEHTVREWQEANPEGRKADCIRETGLSKPTVYRWWKQN